MPRTEYEANRDLSMQRETAEEIVAARLLEQMDAEREAVDQIRRERRMQRMFAFA